jgi:hypothetical protein
MICYSVVNPKGYFTDLGNYIDWAIYIILLFYFVYFHDETVASDGNKILSSLGLILMYYRFFGYFRIVSLFTYLVGMINTIIQKLVIFVIIVVYFLGVTLLLMINLNPEGTFKENFANAYVFSIFGGIGGDDFDGFEYAMIPIIFGTIIVTVILMNILIGYLSNVFSRLEEQQIINNLKEIVSMIMDLEVIVYFFVYFITGKNKSFREYQGNDYEHWGDSIQNINQNKDDQETELDKKYQKIMSMLSSMKYTYIFKALDSVDNFEKNTVSDNIYGKIKFMIRQHKLLEQSLNEHKRNQKQFESKVNESFKKLTDENFKLLFDELLLIKKTQVEMSRNSQQLGKQLGKFMGTSPRNDVE